MLRNRILILLGGCVLAASAAKADDLGYIDCRNHPDETQVFAKARQTHETVASLPCGERFTILLYGFIFSRIQTKDGKVGYVYSNVIASDRSSGTLQTASTRVPVPRTPAPATTTTVAQPKPADAAPQASAPAQVAGTQTPASDSNLPTPAAAVTQPAAAAPASVQPETGQPAPAAASAPPSAVAETNALLLASAPTATTPTNSTTLTSATTLTNSTTPTNPTTQTQPTPAASVSPEASLPPANVPPEAPATAPQLAVAPAPQPEAAAAEPAAPATPARPAVRAANATESWEKPNEGMRTVGLRRLPLIELFGGYAFTRFDNGGGSSTNFNGVLGSFGWNVRPWLQIVADSSYSVVTVSGVKNVLYGNHYGPRIFRRVRNRWGITPFVEGLVGGTRADTSISGTGGYSTSVNCLSYKVGGGVDIHPSRHIEIRLVDFDYYRTAFGTNLHQNNYWASTGIVIRLFGGSE